MVTPAEKWAYVRKLQEIERRFGKLESDTLRRSIELLRDFRNRVAGHMSELTDFEQWRIHELQANLDGLIAQYEGQLQGMTANSIRASVNLGRAVVAEPLASIGLTNIFFRSSPAQINVLLDFSADLIRGIGHDMRKRINNQIRISALGEKSSFQAMKDITTILGLPDKSSEVVKGIAYEAERILRTETNRAYNLASFSQQRDLAEQVPGLLKMWMATGDNRTRDSHLEAHGQIVLATEPFIIGKDKVEMMFPGDPAGTPEETINCRCRPVTVIPEIGRIRTPLDVKIEKELARRAELKKAKAAKKAAKAGSPKDVLMARLEPDVRQSLNRYGDSLVVYDSDGDLVLTYAKELSLVPDKVVNQLLEDGYTKS